MKSTSNKYINSYFRKILIPVFYGYDSKLSLQIGRALAEDSEIVLAGLVGVDSRESLSTGASNSQELRGCLQKMRGRSRLRVRSPVIVTYNLSEGLQRVIQEENPDLVLMDWPGHFEKLQTTPAKVLQELTCDVGIVRGPLPKQIRRVLTPMRGGPHAELALRITLAIGRSQGADCTSLHILPKKAVVESEAPFRGISQVLEQLPGLEKLEMVSDDPLEGIQSLASRYDLLVMGATARPPGEVSGLGKVTQGLMESSPTGMVIVKTPRSIDFEKEGEAAGRQAISVLVDRWFAQNTYSATEFADLDELVQLKESQGLTISVALPALNEEKTVGNVIETIKRPLMDEAPLIDEIVLMDSDSTDRTREIASSLGIPVYVHQHVLEKYGARRGKGEALWKSLYVTRGDIVLWLDTDISNIHPHFIYGLIGPLLANPKIEFVKGFYRRPIRVGERVLAGGGGRVTELTARPLINLFFPELSGVIQPLSGEYGGRRSLLERLPFFSGYGVEIGLLIDVLQQRGLDAIAQVDLRERIHHNQPLEALSKMSFAIIQAVMRKMEIYFGRSTLEEVNQTMKLIRYETGRLHLEVEEIDEQERPPMDELPEYLEARRT